MALQQWQPPGWGTPSPTAPLAHGPAQARLRDRLRRQLVIVLALGTLGFFLGLTRSGRGWLAIGLAWLLVALLGAHRRDGGARWLARVVCEYAVVAVLAVLVATTIGGMHPQQPARQSPKASAAGELCPAVVRGLAGGLCDRLDQAWAWQQAKRKTGQQQTPTTTTRAHRR